MAEGPPDFIVRVLVAGGLATMALATILEGSQGLRWSRLSLPFLVGTMLVGDRSRAMVVGFAVYLFGGWLFEVLEMDGRRVSRVRATREAQDEA